MSRYHAIRWRETDSETVKKTVNNFNQKLYRVKKKNIAQGKEELNQYLPQRLKLKDVQAELQKGTRREFNNWVNEHKRFSKRGSEEIVHGERGLHRTKWEITEFNRKQAIRNREANKKRKKIEEKQVKVGGKEQGTERAKMGTIEENDLKERKKDPLKMSQKEFELARKAIDHAIDDSKVKEKQDRMKENYLKGLRENGFLDANDDLEKIIREIDFDTFLETVETDDTATFLFYKDPQAWDVRLEYITNSWYSAYSDYTHRKMKAK